MRRFGRGAAIVATFALLGGEPASGSAPPGASAELALQAEYATGLAQAVKKTAECASVEEKPSRPGDALIGDWVVTTSETVAIAKEFALREAERSPAEREESAAHRLNFPPLNRSVTVSRTRFLIRTEGKLVSREYDVLRDTGVEVEVQLRGGDRERAVLTLVEKNKLDAPSLVGLAGGTTWRRPATPGVGLP
jgi:hypothetical protein